MRCHKKNQRTYCQTNWSLYLDSSYKKQRSLCSITLWLPIRQTHWPAIGADQGEGRRQRTHHPFHRLALATSNPSKWSKQERDPGQLVHARLDWIGGRSEPAAASDETASPANGKAGRNGKTNPAAASASVRSAGTAFTTRWPTDSSVFWNFGKPSRSKNKNGPDPTCLTFHVRLSEQIKLN